MLKLKYTYFLRAFESKVTAIMFDSSSADHTE